MSSIANQIIDSLMSIIDMIHAERDPIQKLTIAMQVEQETARLLKELKQEAAYDARMAYPTLEVADLVDSNRKTIEHLVNKHMERNPQLPKPPHHNKSRITTFLDLRSESDRLDGQASTN